MLQQVVTRASSSSSREKTVSVVLARILNRRATSWTEAQVTSLDSSLSRARAAAEAGAGSPSPHNLLRTSLRFRVNKRHADDGAASPNNDNKAKACSADAGSDDACKMQSNAPSVSQTARVILLQSFDSATNLIALSSSARVGGPSSLSALSMPGSGALISKASGLLTGASGRLRASV